MLILITNLVNIMKKGMLVLLPVFLLTACTSKSDIVLELDAQEKMQAAEESEGEAAGLLADVNAGGDVPLGAEETEIVVLPAEIYVHICGAVRKPGVYRLETGSRIYEGVEAAGGFCEDACEDFLNLALPMQDGQRIVIPTEEEAQIAKEDAAYQETWLSQAAEMGVDAAIGDADGNSSQRADGRININTATEQELGSISGIGAGKAAAVIQYREENGSFASIEDIMKVSGIKEGTFEKIKDKITVD